MKKCNKCQRETEQRYNHASIKDSKIIMSYLCEPCKVQTLFDENRQNELVWMDLMVETKKD